MKYRNIIESYIQSYNAFDVDSMLNCLTENVVFENISNTGNSINCSGKDAFEKLAQKSVSVFKSRKQTVRNWIIAEQKVAVEIDYFAVLAIDLNSKLKAGAELRLRGVSVFEFEGGKISRIADYS